MTTETITWRESSTPPDDNMTVLVVPAAGGDDDVWIGWFDSEVSKWRDAATGGLMFGVAFWADVPAGPSRGDL